MAGETLLGSNQSLSNSINTIVTEFRLKRQDSGVVRRLSTEYKLEPHTGTTKYVDFYNQLQALSLTDGVDMQQAQSLSDNQVSYVPAEVGVQMIMADSTLRRTADPDLLMRAGRVMANAIDLKEDQDGCAQAANFTAAGASGIPGAGNQMTVGTVLASRGRLRTGNSTITAMPAPPPYFGIFHPYTFTSLAGKMIPLASTPSGTTPYNAGSAGTGVGPATGARDNSDDLIRRGAMGVQQISDVTLYEDANVQISGTDAKNFIFSKEGLVYCLELAPYYEAHRDPSLRATELNMVTSYVFGTYLASNYGTYNIADATAPVA